MLGYPVRVSLDKYGSSLFALFPFFIQGPSAIGTASAIISCSSFGNRFSFGPAPSFRTRTCAAVINECNQVVQAAHRKSPEKGSPKSINIVCSMMMKKGGNLRIYQIIIAAKCSFFKF